MAKEKIEIWEHIMIRPCYVNYFTFRHQTLGQLHNSWLEAVDNYDSMDLELRVQAWHDLMALAKCFREREEWDTKKRCPKILVTREVVGKPMWITNGLKPGTAEWIEHWRAFPKEQPSMARHTQRLRKEEA